MINSDNFLSRIEGRVGVIELLRSSALNSLNLGMIRNIDQALDMFGQDDQISVISIASSSPRAFCAGGDVRWVRDEDLSGDYSAGDNFFREEYALNQRLSELGKPIVALLEGVVMGGGFGISAHGSHRVVTPRTIGAMPESAIGFVTDVGMSHVLTHLGVGAEIGAFIALTGWRLSPADMMYTGLATHHVDDIDALRGSLRNNELVEALATHSVPVEGDSELEKHAEEIRAAFAKDEWVDVEKILTEGESAFHDKVRELLAAANPTSLVAGYELLKRSVDTDLPTALDNELRVGSALRRQPNFAEGVRAVLVDKDHKPAFEPASAKDVDPQVWRDLLR